jgi:hypothetical protein
MDGVPRVFAEYLPGGSLREWIDDRRLYAGTEGEALARILDLAVQTAWGLQHAHDHGLVHQDVKPANVLLDADGTAKVTDFGLARGRPVQGPPGSAGTALSVPVAGGGLTPAYASPEQSAGRTLGRRTDVWSLGVSVLEMFTGGISWSAGPVAGAALAEYLRHGPPAAQLPPMPAAVADLLTRCLQLEPEARPRTVAAIADELVAAYREATGEEYRRPAPRAADLRADGFSNRALSLLDLDRPDEADQAFAAALAVDPRHPYAVYNSALVRWRRAEIADDEAVGLLEEARAAAADPAHVGSLLARIHLERGALEHARPLLDAAPAEDTAEEDFAAVLDPPTAPDGEQAFGNCACDRSATAATSWSPAPSRCGTTPARGRSCCGTSRRTPRSAPCPGTPTRSRPSTSPRTSASPSAARATTPSGSGTSPTAPAGTSSAGIARRCPPCP